MIHLTALLLTGEKIILLQNSEVATVQPVANDVTSASRHHGWLQLHTVVSNNICKLLMMMDFSRSDN